MTIQQSLAFFTWRFLPFLAVDAIGQVQGHREAWGVAAFGGALALVWTITNNLFPPEQTRPSRKATTHNPAL